MDPVAVSAISERPGGNYRPLDQDHVRRLAEKIREEGFRPELGRIGLTSSAPGSWWIVFGHHRLAALISLGFEKLESEWWQEVATTSAGELLAEQVAENSCRREAPAWAEAEAFDQLVKDGFAVETIAKKVGRTSGYVTRRLELMKVDPAVRKMALPFSWLEILTDLPWTVQREVARVADDKGMNAAAWRSLVDAARVAWARSQEAPLLALVVEEWSAQREKVQVHKNVPVGKREIATLLEAKPSAVYQWHARRLLPAPAFTVGGHDAWWSDDILAWARETGRLESSP